MKALFSRFNKGLSHKDKDKDKFSSSSDSPVSTHREKLPEAPTLHDWTPPSQQPQRVTSTPSSVNSTKPLPDLSVRPLPTIDASPVPVAKTHSQASTASSRAGGPPVLPPPIHPDDGRDGLGLGITTVTLTRPNVEAPKPEPKPNNFDLAFSTRTSATTSARRATDASVTSTVHTTGNDTHGTKKQVAFISPPPTPAPLQRVLSEADSIPTSGDAFAPAAQTAAKPTPAPLKTSVTRFQATHGVEARASTSGATSSKGTAKEKATSNGGTAKSSTIATRTALSPNTQKAFADNASLNPSARAGTPYSQASQSTSRILATMSWSEAAEEDLVSNLGPRERTRQEVLWEIVTSEERYVQELMKLKETFIEPLLHPYSTYISPMNSPTPTDHDDRAHLYHYTYTESPRESLDRLPIASRFLSPTPGLRSDTPVTVVTPPSMKDSTPNIDGDSIDTDEDEGNDQLGRAFSPNGHAPRRQVGSVVAAAVAKFHHPRSPYNTTGERSTTGKAGDRDAGLPFPSRSHQSLPPPPRGHPSGGSTASLGRQSIVGMPPEDAAPSTSPHDRKNGASSSASKVLRKLRKSTTQSDVLPLDALAPHQIPEDLRKCLEVLESGIYNGHVTLSEGLRRRYEEQYPLVRSLADVFINNSHILHEYATYVLHLERALEQVDNALSTASETKRPKKQDAAEWMKVCKVLQRLEETAVEKGETGLAISLSKPFQRLLKYPLLFQNLLYHTDPSTFEYESTLQMVAEVETIVRSIEDEKIQKEERDKTRDAFARIEGLEKVKQLALPKASRLLVEERVFTQIDSHTQSVQLTQSKPSKSLSPPTSGKNVKGKTSFRRLSDVLGTGSGGIGGKKDLWLVVFNDVVLRCQRTGVTTLPLVSTTNARTNSLPELQAKAKYATTGRKGSHTKPRNLYKFIKIENWAIGDVVQPRQGVVSMEEVVRSRAQVHSGAPTGVSSILPDEDEDDGVESDESDRKSKMSFSYWGADKVTVHKPAIKGRQTPGRKGANGLTPLGYGRESSANAKFGNRLVNNQDGPHHNARPASRRTQATPTSRRPGHSEDGHSSAKSTITSTRPAWDGSTRAATTTPVSAKRSRNVSQTTQTTQASTVAPRASNKSLASPAPSEDSGVGFYRQLMAQDSSLGRV